MTDDLTRLKALEAAAKETPMEINVHKFAGAYEFRGDAGDYTPTDAERAMLEDFGESLLDTVVPPLLARIERGEGERDKALAAVAFIADEGTYSDSYGVPGSNFGVCRFCEAGGAPGVPFEHNKTCPILRCEEVAEEWWQDRKADLEAVRDAEQSLSSARAEGWKAGIEAAAKVVLNHYIGPATSRAANYREANVTRPVLATAILALEAPRHE